MSSLSFSLQSKQEEMEDTCPLQEYVRFQEKLSPADLIVEDTAGDGDLLEGYLQGVFARRLLQVTVAPVTPEAPPSGNIYALNMNFSLLFCRFPSMQQTA